MTSDPTPSSATGARRPLVRVLRTALRVAGACLVVWLLAAYQLFCNPALPPVREADAVIVLAGAASERLAVGQALLERGAAGELVLSSTGLPGNAETDDLCARGATRTMCFHSDPMTTRGEARAIADLARERGWDDIIVVTSTYHVARASMNVSQCSKATVIMAESRPDLSVAGWLARFVEESTALAASVVRPACSRSV
ncbi:YdcF family protein [Arthrobacter sp. MDB2-24]